jgi:MFS family permease
MDSAGAVVGPLLSLALVAEFGFRKTFLLTLVPGVLAALCIWILVQEKERAEPKQAAFSDHFRDLPRPFRQFLVGVGVAGLGDFSNTLLILWATQAFLPAYGKRASLIAILLYAGYNVVYTISCYFAGLFADRFRKANVLAIGYAIAVLPAIFLLFPGSSILKFVPIFAFSGLYMGFWETVESSAAAEFLPPNLRGTGFGVLATVNGIGDFASSILVGSLWVLSPAISMAYVIVTSIAGAFLIYHSAHYARRVA